MTVRDIYDYIDGFAPFSSQEDWDNSGLLVGSYDKKVSKVTVSLDVTESEINQAAENNCQLIVSHHPVIFRPQKSFLSSSVCYKAAEKGISIICAHTNLDKAPGGVNDTLCESLGLDYKKISGDIAGGFLNVGILKNEMSAEILAIYIKKCLGGAVRFSDAGKNISKVAVCSGAGSDFIWDALNLGCDALITGDASYHDLLDAKNAGLSLFAAGHYDTEVIIVNKLIKLFSSEFKNIEFIASDSKSPVITVK